MIKKLVEYLRAHRDDAYLLLRRYASLDKKFLLSSDSNYLPSVACRDTC